MKTSAPFIFIIVLIVALAGLFAFFVYTCDDDWCFYFEWQKVRAADSFERCLMLGFPTTDSAPRECRAREKVFTDISQKIVENADIRVLSPLSNVVVTSPLVVKGEARGTWYFEASFPVRIFDANGTQLALKPAQAKGEWMTESFVPFEVTLEFSPPTTDTGIIVLEKDNPSGLPSNARSILVPIRFREGPGVRATGILEGTMTIGPLCPVEEEGVDCAPSREVFAEHQVSIYHPDRKTLVTTITPNHEGIFRAILPIGSYYVDTKRAAVGSVDGLPQEVVIQTGATTLLYVDIDTGIR